MNHRLLCSLGFVVTLAACGGKVVFVEDDGSSDDGSGAGGQLAAGGGPGSSSSVTPSTSSGGSECDLLAADLAAANQAAATCDPFLNLIQCNGSATVNDTCGCPAVLANENAPELVAKANGAYDAWTQAGCGPFPCESCTPATGGFCQKAVDGPGICVNAIKQ